LNTKGDNCVFGLCQVNRMTKLINLIKINKYIYVSAREQLYIMGDDYIELE